jgi:hypothetical protein
MYKVCSFKQRQTDRRMLSSLAMLAAEANSVTALGMMTLMKGVKRAARG